MAHIEDQTAWQKEGDDVFETAGLVEAGRANQVEFTCFASPAYVILVMYSGRRRNGDIACQLLWSQCCEGYQVIPVMIDIAFHEAADMMAQVNVNSWAAKIKDGQVV